MRFYSIRLYLLTIPIVCSLVSFAALADPAKELMERSEKATKSHTEHTTYRMDLLNQDGKVEQTRTSEYFYKRNDDEERTLQKFTDPPVLRGSGMLIIDRGKVVNDIWMYLPTTRRLRRIAGTEKSNRYMGTEFTYEDFEDYQIPYYHFTLLAHSPCDADEKCIQVEAVPSAAQERKASGYSRKVYWIGEQTLYPRRIDYYDHDGKQVKTLRDEGLERVGGYWRAKLHKMENKVTGRSTAITILSREVDQPLRDYFVSKRYLRKD